MQSRGYKPQLSPLEKAINKLEDAHLYYYVNILRYGPNLFEDDGDIFLQNKDYETKTKTAGREFITQTLKYYEAKDEPNFYRMCAKLKRVLDDYDKRFPQKKCKAVEPY